MIVQVPVISQLAAAIGSAARETPQDSILTVPPAIYPTISIPKPLGDLATGSTPISGLNSFHKYLEKTSNADSSETVFGLAPGLWRLNYNFMIDVAGVSDYTAYGQLTAQLLRTVAPFTTLTCTLVKKRVYGGFLSWRREYDVFVPRETTYEVLLVVDNGAGTTASQISVSVIGTRLL